jgi:hypothetical protein
VGAWRGQGVATEGGPQKKEAGRTILVRPAVLMVGSVLQATNPPDPLGRARGAGSLVPPGGGGINNGGPARPRRRARALVADTSSEECHLEEAKRSSTLAFPGA